MKNNYASIKLKLLRVVLATSGVVLFLTCSAFFAYEYFTYRQTAKDQLSTLGKIVAGNSTAALAFQSQNDANEILMALKAETHIVAACLYDESGKLFARYPSTVSESQIPKDPQLNGYQYNNSYLEGFQPVVQNGKRLGTLYLKSDMEVIYKRFKLYIFVTLFVVVIAICVAYLLSGRLYKSVSSPILALAKTAGIVSNKKDYSVRAEKFDNDEVGELTDAFNQMLSEIERQNAEILIFNHALENKVTARTNELKQANEQLQLKNEFVEKIIDASVDVIAVFDKSLNYIMLNKYAQEVYDVRSENVYGKNILEVFPTLGTSQMFIDLKKSLSGERVHNPYYRSTISDKILENFYVPLLDGNGDIYNVLVIGHDITQIVQTNEKLLSLNGELAKSNRDLEQFAYVASHDLQEPLRKIQTYSSMLEKSLDDQTISLNYIAKIVSSVIRMGDLIKSILNYSQASNTRASFEPVDLNHIIDDIIVDFELLIEEKKVTISVAKLPTIDGDRLQLSQLFHNLISNSIKFSKTQPEITIDSSVGEENEVAQNEFNKSNAKYVKLLFRDNGIGFDQKFSDKIFTIFQRLHSTKQYPGTGIGLALCKKIVDNHGGHISATSAIGVGSTFTIYLPLYPSV